MFNENDLESVYVVGQEITDRNLGETEESDTEHDPRRLGLAYYDAVCDEVDNKASHGPNFNAIKLNFPRGCNSDS